MALRLNGSTSGYVELNAPAVAGSTSLNVPFGVIQVVQTVKSDTFSTSNSGYNTFIDITGLSLSITPKFSSSKILLMATVQGSGVGWGYLCSLRFVRGSTAVGVGDSRTGFMRVTQGLLRGSQDDNSTWNTHMQYLDSPATTSAITYKIQGQVEPTGGFRINRTANDNSGTNYSSQGISTLTALEIAA